HNCRHQLGAGGEGMRSKLRAPLPALPTSRAPMRRVASAHFAVGNNERGSGCTALSSIKGTREGRGIVMMRVLVVLLLVLGAPGVRIAQAQQLQPPTLLGVGTGAGGGTAACSDGQDNDGDGIADYPGDAGCDSPSDTDESGDDHAFVTG